MKISKGTIIRLAMVIIVVINLILKAMGKNIINIDEETITYYLQSILEIAIIVVGVWKNNSVSDKAIKADRYLQALRDGLDEDEEIVG